MGILSDIFSKIFPSSHPAAAGLQSSGTVASTAPVAPGSTPAASAAPMTEVDVESMLDQRVGQAGEKLNWRTSIVDLMKPLGLDSSLASRKQLAQELHYSGDTNDSGAMNIWLHKQVMGKIAANGGKVPADLK